MRQAFASLALAVVFIAGCSTVAPSADGLDGPTTTITLGAGADDLATLGVPFVDGQPVVKTVGVSVYAIDGSGSEVALRFRFAEGQFRYDPDGPLTIIGFDLLGAADVALPAGHDYGFEATGADVDKTWLAYGLTTAHVDAATTNVRLALQTMVDTATFDTIAATTTVDPSQLIDLHLVVHAPGGYSVPVADYAVSYAILPDDGTLGATSKVGTRAVAAASPADDVFTVSATITGWRDVAGVATVSDVTVSFEAPYAVTSGLSFDTTAPFASIDAATEPAYVGSAHAVSGTATDDTGVDRVQLYEGPVLIGSTEESEYVVDGVAPIALDGLVDSWTMDWTPAEARSHTLTAFAIDTVGNEHRASATIEVGQPDVSLATLANWWETTPLENLYSFGAMRIQFTFEYMGTDGITFVGSGGGADPATELQYWTDSFGEPPVVVHAYPQGDYGPGTLLTWDATFDVSELPISDTYLALRPTPTGFGTLGPNSFTLVFQSVTLGD